ncbi:MAG: integrase core domain-containing protein, partial [Thermodesulfovibrio sp.]|nr:integrase core domain-containing protein [Thermodesulfovibrio sp.]
SKSVAELCREHNISQALYYRLRDKFLEGEKSALVDGSSIDSSYKAEIERLQNGVGKHAIQIEILKKTEELLVLDWYTKKIVGHEVSLRGRKAFMKDMAVLGIEQIFTFYDNPKGNAETERVMRTIKEELIWVKEFSSFEEAKERIREWVGFYNRFYLHSSLGYLSPKEYEIKYHEGQRRDVA